MPLRIVATIAHQIAGMQHEIWRVVVDRRCHARVHRRIAARVAIDHEAKRNRLGGRRAEAPAERFDSVATHFVAIVRAAAEPREAQLVKRERRLVGETLARCQAHRPATPARGDFRARCARA